MASSICTILYIIHTYINRLKDTAPYLTMLIFILKVMVTSLQPHDKEVEDMQSVGTYTIKIVIL